MRRLGLALLVLLALLPLDLARAGTVEEHLGPGEPTVRDFEEAFLPLLPEDQQAFATLTEWEDPHVGGWGGHYDPEETCDPERPPRRPVVFVHGTTEDATFWRAQESGDGTTVVDVRQRFLDAGWCPGELWAISYTGAKGYFTYNDINAGEVGAFIAAVRRYTGAPKVDVVAHSLGVTVVRKAVLDEPRLGTLIARFVALAGANHGTTTCRGVGEAEGSEVCRELHPGSPWLAALNAGGEDVGRAEVLVLYDSRGDHFYVGPDAQSPTLAGACNVDMPLTFHNALARSLPAVERYRDFLAQGHAGAAHPVPC